MKKMLRPKFLVIAVSTAFITGVSAQYSVTTPVNTAPSGSFPGWTYHNVTDNSSSIYYPAYPELGYSGGGNPAPDYFLPISPENWQIHGTDAPGNGGLIWSPAFVMTIPPNTTISPADVTGSVTYQQFTSIGGNDLVGYISTTPATSAELLALGDYYDFYSAYDPNNPAATEPSKSPNAFLLTQSQFDGSITTTITPNSWGVNITTNGAFNGYDAAPQSVITSGLTNNADTPKIVYIYLGLGNSIGDATYHEIDNIQFTLSSSAPVTLPVHYASELTAKQKGATTVLNWTTATEINNKGFYIQRITSDKNFTGIGFVASQASNGNSTKTLLYTYTDASPLQGKNYYRLVQEDLDGKSTPSGIVSIDFSGAGSGLNVYPNPAHSFVTFTGLQAGSNVVIYSVSGHVVKSFTATIALQQVDISGLPEGVYFVKVLNNSDKASTTFVVK